jgi:hypothetical protein
MKLEDFKRTGGTPPIMITAWEVILDDKVQEVYDKYAKDNLKLNNTLIQFPMTLTIEEDCYSAVYWNEAKMGSK